MRPIDAAPAAAHARRSRSRQPRADRWRSQTARSRSPIRPSASARSRSHSIRPSHSPSPTRITGKCTDRSGLDQRQRLEQLVERAEPAWTDHERPRVADEHDLAGKEMPEAQGDVEVRVERLLAGQLDVAPDRRRAGVPCATVGGLHQAGAATGDDRVSGPTELGADLMDERVVWMVSRRAGRAEDRHRRTDVGKRVESLRQLRRDLADAPGVGGPNVPGLVAEPQQQLLVERRTTVRGRPNLGALTAGPASARRVRAPATAAAGVQARCQAGRPSPRRRRLRSPRCSPGRSRPAD